MTRKMTVFVYLKNVGEFNHKALHVLKRVVPGEQIEVCRTIEELSGRLRMATYDSAIAVLLASDSQDLRDILLVRPILSNVRTLLILPDRENNTIALGHSLRPRFIAYKDGDWYETASVLGKMLEAAGAPKRPWLSGRQADSAKYLSRNRGYQMAKGCDNQSQIKSLPPFIYSKKIRLRKSNLNEIIRGMESVFPRYAAGNIDFKTAFVGEDLRVMADVARIGEVLVHLIENAKDAMPSGGVLTFKTKKIGFEDKPTMVDNLQLPGARALLSVSDTGTGMDKAIRERIFEPFFTTKEGEGKGLGLPIASHIIKQHNGSMSVESQPGTGTTVNIYLPLLSIEPPYVTPIPL
jgi:hypothetical protein